MEYIIAVTGHRPNKLWGYDLTHPYYLAMQRYFMEYLKEHKCTDAWTGMALGVDTVFAHAVLCLKYEGYPIKLRCAIPCKNQSSAWQDPSRNHYKEILSMADQVHMVTDKNYTPECMEIRNKFLVNHSDRIIAVWNRSRGGTGNCVHFAKRVHRPIDIIEPEYFEEAAKSYGRI